MSTRKFRVTVDGEAFEVEVEELAGPGLPVGHGRTDAPTPARRPEMALGTPPPAGPVVPVPPAAVRPIPVVDAPRKGDGAAPRTHTPPGAGVGERVEAPLPGTVLSVNVKPGDTVKAGDVLLVLEAMKMQNEIVAPRAGTVRDVGVAKGDTVALGDVLVTIE